MKKIITFGTFDLFHLGHLKLLERAKEMGDYLIVGVSSEELNWNKKQKLPIFPCECWTRNKYYPMTKEQIKTLWSKNAEEAMIQETKLYADIESYLNNIRIFS